MGNPGNNVAGLAISHVPVPPSVPRVPPVPIPSRGGLREADAVLEADAGAACSCLASPNQPRGGQQC